MDGLYVVIGVRKATETSTTETVAQNALAIIISVTATVQHTETCPAVRTHAFPTLPTTKQTTRRVAKSVAQSPVSATENVQRISSDVEKRVVRKTLHITWTTTGHAAMHASKTINSVMENAHLPSSLVETTCAL